MKIRAFVMVLSLGLVVSACRKEYTDLVEREPVRFSTSVASSKADVAATDNFLPSMGVFCSSTDLALWDASVHSPNKMFHTKMLNTNYGVGAGTASVWDYAVSGEAAYWDSGLGSRFTFFGYAPYASPDNGISLTSTAASVGVPTVRYDAPLDVGKRVDLVVAEPRVNIHPMGSVGLTMRHALSAVDFEVRLKNVSVGTVRVKRITLHHVQQGGDFALTADAVDGVAWTVDYAKDKERDEAIASSNILNSNALTTTYASVVKSGQALFVVPQPMIPPVVHTDLSPLSITVVFDDNGTEFVAPTHALTLLPDWQPGSVYVYQIIYDQGQDIVVTGCSVVDWTVNYDASADVSI